MLDQSQPGNASSQAPPTHRLTAAAMGIVWFGPEGEMWTSVDGQWEEAKSKAEKTGSKPIWGPPPEYHFHGGVDPKVNILYFGPDMEMSVGLPS